MKLLFLAILVVLGSAANDQLTYNSLEIAVEGQLKQSLDAYYEAQKTSSDFFHCDEFTATWNIFFYVNDMWIRTID